MNLTDALRINQRASAEAGADPFCAALCCGFTPMHLTHFLTAHLHLRLPGRKVHFVPTPYGDAIACLDQIPPDAEVAFVTLEWQDLDPRLGFRQADWRPGIADDIIATARLRLALLAEKVSQVSGTTPACLSLPTLPTPSLLPASPNLQDAFRAESECLVSEACRRLIRIPHVTVLAKTPPPGSLPVYDIKNDVRFGSPYSVAFQSDLARRLTEIAFPPQPLKGLITDLDNTLWRGTIGEVGVGSTHWDLDRKSYLHAFYQQALRALSESGVLLAVASKNDPDIAEGGLSRPDLLVPGSTFFPKEIHWDSKVGSVRRILQSWNLGPESILFLDDSPSEIAEVQSAYPQIHTRQFPTHDDGAIFALVSEFRDLFSRRHLSAEDHLRAASISIADRLPLQAQDAGDPDAFLRHSEAQVQFQLTKRDDPRAFELLNKTNQFNLNGERITPKAWINLLNRDDATVLVVSYEDKFGNLGKISVLVGVQNGTTFDIIHWVLSCRAFSKRIEHQSLRFVFEHLKADSIRLHFQETNRNRPLADLITQMSGEPPSGNFVLAKDIFFDHCPHLFHSITLVNDI